MKYMVHIRSFVHVIVGIKFTKIDEPISIDVDLFETLNQSGNISRAQSNQIEVAEQ